MKSILKRTATVFIALAVMMSMMPLLGTITGGAIPAGEVYAETEVDVTTPDGFKLHLWYSDAGASVAVRGYTGTSTEIILPTSVTYGGKTYSVAGGNGDFFVDENAFKGNTKITKAAVPDGYYNVGAGAFYGCTGLTEVAIGNDVMSIGGYHFESDDLSNSTFYGCSNLTTYRIGASAIANENNVRNSGIGQASNLSIYSGVTVYTTTGSVLDTLITKWNAATKTGNVINVKYDDPDPYAHHTVKPGTSGGESSGGGSSDGGSSGGATETKGEDGTPYGKGASESVVDKALKAVSSENDPKGTAFGLLQARITKVTKSSLTLKWKKVPGAKKYIIYGNKCGKTNRLKKQTTVTGTGKVFKKVAGKKVKKGTYYKFVVVAIDGKGKVISTSKFVHAATKGGKYGNDKSITTKAKKNKVSIKKGKTFKLAAKAVPQSKKLKVLRHRKVSYESSNNSIATVNAKGVIKGKKKGTCYVYAYAQVGVFKKIKVTVK